MGGVKKKGNPAQKDRSIRRRHDLFSRERDIGETGHEISVPKALLRIARKKLPAKLGIKGFFSTKKVDETLRKSKVLQKFLQDYQSTFYSGDKEKQEKVLARLIDLGVITANLEHPQENDPLTLTTPDLRRVLFLEEQGIGKDETFLDNVSKVHPLQVKMGVGHTHLDTIKGQLGAIERNLLEQWNIDVSDLSDTETIQHMFDSLIEQYKHDEASYEYVQPAVRRENARSVNKAQEIFLKDHGIHAPIAFEEERALVLYFREEGRRQMDGFLLCWSYLICKWFVEQSGFAKVFDKVQVVSRRPNQYPKTLHSLGLLREDYLNVQGEEFRLRTSVGANLVHFTHGTVHGNKYGSQSILGTSTRNDIDKIRNLGSDYISVPLYYFPENDEASKTEGLETTETDYSGDLYGTIRVMAKAIQDLEEKMLIQASPSTVKEV